MSFERREKECQPNKHKYLALESLECIDCIGDFSLKLMFDSKSNIPIFSLEQTNQTSVQH